MTNDNYVESKRRGLFQVYTRGLCQKSRGKLLQASVGMVGIGAGWVLKRISTNISQNGRNLRI